MDGWMDGWMNGWMDRLCAFYLFFNDVLNTFLLMVISVTCIRNVFIKKHVGH